MTTRPPSGAARPAPVTAEQCVALVPVFSRLSAAQQAEVAKFARPLTVPAGRALFRAGEHVSWLFVLHEGQVRISHTNEAGRETILRVLGPGDVGGELSFLTGDHPANDAVALEGSRLCVFDHVDLSRLLTQVPAVGVGMLQVLAGKLTSTERMLTALAGADVGARVAAYLLDCPSSMDRSGRTIIHLPVAKKDIAAFLGTTPETLSRRLAGFAADGLIRLGRSRDIELLNAAGLARRAGAVS